MFFTTVQMTDEKGVNFSLLIFPLLVKLSKFYPFQVWRLPVAMLCKFPKLMPFNIFILKQMKLFQFRVNSACFIIFL